MGTKRLNKTLVEVMNWPPRVVNEIVVERKRVIPETEIMEIEIDGWLVPKALFRLYVGLIRDARAGIDVVANDLSRTYIHSKILEYCEGNTETFEEALKKAVGSVIRDEND